MDTTIRNLSDEELNDLVAANPAARLIGRADHGTERWTREWNYAHALRDEIVRRHEAALTAMNRNWANPYACRAFEGIDLVPLTMEED